MAGKQILSPAERYLVVKVHKYFAQEKNDGKPGSKGSMRNRVKDATSFSTTTIDAIIKNWNEFEDPTFSKVP